MFKIIISDTIYARIKAAESGKPAQEQSALRKLLRQQPVQQLTAEETLQFKNHPEEVLKTPSALYILDISPAEALRIQASYGVMCLSGEQPDISPLIDVNDYFQPSTKNRKFKGWDRILDSVEKLPSNALVIIDRYLFSKRSKDAGDGLANVYSILRELLPQTFEGGDYHLTVVFNIDATHPSYTFSEIAAKLTNITRQLRPQYNTMVEAFAIKESCTLYDDSHDRRIVSNYFYVVASHKLAAFNPEDKGTVPQSISPWALFTESSLTGDSSAPLESIEETIDDFHKFYAALPNPAEHNTYLYALNGKRMERCMGVRNRLLK